MSRAFCPTFGQLVVVLLSLTMMIETGHSAGEASDAMEGESEPSSSRFVRLGVGAGYSHLQLGKYDEPSSGTTRTTAVSAFGMLNLEAAVGARLSERNAFYGWSVFEWFVVPNKSSSAFRGGSGRLGALIKLGVGHELSFGDDRATLSFAAGSVLQLFAFGSQSDIGLAPVDDEVRANAALGVGGEIQLAFRLNDTLRPDGLAIYGGSHVVFRDGREFVAWQVGLRAIVWRRGLR